MDPEVVWCDCELIIMYVAMYLQDICRCSLEQRKELSTDRVYTAGSYNCKQAFKSELKFSIILS